jgi:chorismate synthase
MPGNSFGQVLRMTTAGESHGPAQVVIIDGCPPGIALSEEDLAHDLGRRRPGQSALTSPRQEQDGATILSGVFEGRTMGTSVAILIPSTDARPRDYAALQEILRPGHADATYLAKYGMRDHRGGGRASARETASRVAAGVVAKKILAGAFGGRVVGYVSQVGDVRAEVPDPAAVTEAMVEVAPDGGPNPTRCPDPEAAARMEAAIEAARADQDSLGGVATVVATGVPPGLGEPVFGKLKADLASALFGLPAVVGVEYGAGFAAAAMRGSAHNDPFTVDAQGAFRTVTNHHGGILGGISSGMPIVLKAAVKPTSSIPRPQTTVTTRGETTDLEVRGRHDPCLLPRFIPMAEAMVAWVLADHWLRHVAQTRALPSR